MKLDSRLIAFEKLHYRSTIFSTWYRIGSYIEKLSLQVMADHLYLLVMFYMC
jgi:hypothetical protein